MKSTFKSLLVISLIAASMAASAQTSMTNAGAIGNSTRAVADVNGAPGTSFSVSRGEAGATAAGSVSMIPGTANGLTGAVGFVTGDSTTRNVATAFNVSTGAGTGSGSSTGFADSTSFGAATFAAAPGMGLSLAGSSDTGSRDGSNGSNASVTVGTNQDAGAFGSSHGSFNVSGFVGAATGATTIFVGSVADVKTSEAQAETFRMTFTGTQPVGMTQGSMSAHGAAEVTTSASFSDVR
jgi:hypothetical protein